MHDEPSTAYENAAFYFVMALMVLLGIVWESVAFLVRYARLVAAAVMIGVIAWGLW